MDDDRPIEQLLKTYAQQRREAAGVAPQLHEARRRALQAEVSRQYPRTHPTGFVWPSWWPRFALALGVLMLGAALAVYVFTPAREPMAADQYAALGPAKKDALGESDGMRAAPAAIPVPATSKPKTFRRAVPGTELARAPQLEAQPMLRSAPAPDLTGAATNTAAIPPSTGTFTAALPTAAIRNVQSFNNSATAPEFNNNALATQVMASFKVEQAGNVIRIIDQDGSVYTGQLQPVRERAPASRSVAAADGPGGNVARSFSIQAIGMNRSLNEPVTFSGNLAVQPQITATPSGRREKRPRGLTSATVEGAGALLNSRISGKAQVGANELITVEAVAVDVPR